MNSCLLSLLLHDSAVYGPPMDVFSFAGIILHTFNQQWPRPTQSIQFDPKTRKMMALSEVERRQQYLDKMIDEAEVLRPLVEECLDYDPAVRPTIATVCERIQMNKDADMKDPHQSEKSRSGTSLTTLLITSIESYNCVICILLLIFY